MERTDRISSEMQKTVSGIIRDDLKDPRIPLMLSVVGATVTKDLKYAKIYVSILGDDEVKKEAMKALKSSNGYIRRQVAAKMNLRIVPELNFILDESIERGAHISSLIDAAIKEDEEKSNG